MYAITKTVKIHHAKAVKQLQAILHLLGDPIAVDGRMGSGTKTAIKQFQNINKLKPDSVIGRNSWLILYNELDRVLDRVIDGLCDTSSSLNTVACKAFNTDTPPIKEFNSNVSDSSSINWLQSLFFLVDNKTDINGEYDSHTQKTVKSIQSKHALSETGDVDTNTWQAIFNEGAQTSNKIAKLFLSNDYISQKAIEEGIDAAAIKAVVKVESNGSGFYSNGRPKILFEGHKFWQELKKSGLDPSALQAENQDIIYPKWTTTHYTGNSKGEYDRLEKAKNIHIEAALKSASWGMFQIMGFNSKPSGFNNVKDFVSTMYEGENRQLDAFFAFLHHEGIFKHLKT